MRTAAILSSTAAPFHRAHRTYYAPLPASRAEGRNVEAGSGWGGPPIDEASGTQNPASPHPHASVEQVDEEDGGTDGNSERAGARERHGKKASRQAAATPAAASHAIARTSHAGGGGGLNQAGKSGRAGERGSGERKRISRIYIGAGTLRATQFNRNRRIGKQSSPTEYVLMKGDDDEEKNRPRRSQRKEKTKERAGANTHRPYRRRKQAIDREKPLEKKRSTNLG